MLDSAAMEHPMKQIVERWLSKIRSARKHKDERFGRFADEAMKFYAGNHDFMWKDEYAAGQGGFLAKGASSSMPTFRMTVNKPFEAVALFGPALYFQNPSVLVSPMTQPNIDPQSFGYDMNDPMMAQQIQVMMQQDQLEASARNADSQTMQCYLNWLLQEQDLKIATRRAITEAIVKGMSLLWIEMFQSRQGGYSYPRATYVSVDDFVQDPDADYVEDVQWIARRCVHPVNLVERKYGLKPGDLKGHLQSMNSQAEMGNKEKEQLKRQKNGTSFDLIEYWEIYSKNGFGDRLKDSKKGESKYNFESFGDNCYIVVAKGIPFPLNMPSWALAEGPEKMFTRSQWPIPMWVDEGCGNGWPCTRLSFYEKPRDVWPMGLFTPCIGELRFINWCMSFLADKVAASSTTYLCQAKAAGVEIQNQIKTGLAPYTVLEISEMLGKNINELVSFLQAPSFSMDIWKMVAEVMQLIDKRTGLTELLYGITGTQIRSAREADVRDQNISVRPDDMASRVEDWVSETSMKLAEAALWNSQPEEVQSVVGRMGAMAWQRMQTQGIDAVVRNYDFRIEAGTTRKPNKGNRVKQLQEFGQISLPLMQSMAQAGQPDTWNAYVSEYAKALDMDASGFLIQPPPPPPEQQGPSPEEMAMQTKMQESQAGMAMDAQKHQQEMQQDSESHRLDMKQKKEAAAISVKAKAKVAKSTKGKK